MNFQPRTLFLLLRSFFFVNTQDVDAKQDVREVMAPSTLEKGPR